jgi:hypothetical protein
MKLSQMRNQLVSLGWWMLVVLCLLQPLAASAEDEQKFDVLQIGPQTYRNVTVTTKSKNYIFIVHSAGMANLKVSELPDDVRIKLGYPDPKQPVVQTNSASYWAKQTMAKLNTPEVQDAEKQLKEKLAQALEGDQTAQARQVLESLTPKAMYITVGTAILIYLFYCYCCRSICQKAGQSPSPLVWLPILQTFPLLRAAGMSGWWFLAFFVPILNFIAGIMWAFKIAKARNKSFLVGVMLLLPVTNLLAFLYLAFSAGNQPAPRKSPRKMEGMALQTA